MAEERGKISKKILHVLHVLWEFLRKIWVALGRSPKAKSTSGTVGKSASQSVSTTSNKLSNHAKQGVKTSTKKTVINSAALKGGTGLGLFGLGTKISNLIQTSSAASVGSTTAGSSTLAGTILSAKTITIILLSSGIFLGGLGTYSYVNHQDPLNMLGTLIKSAYNPNNNLNSNQSKNNALNTTNNVAPGTETGANSNTDNEITESSATTSSSTGGGTDSNTGGTDNTQSSSNNNQNNDGSSIPSINFTVP